MKREPGLPAHQVGTALIGLGKVADMHAHALASLPESRFVGVLDSDARRTTEFATRYGVHAYRSLQELLNDAAVDAVTVCTPHRAHAELAVAIAMSGRHVLVEKPMATTLAECDAMIAAAEEHRVRLSVMSQRRWYESVRRVKAALEDGKIGRPILATLVLLGWRGPEYYAMDAWRGSWAGEGGGLLVNQATHHLDLLRWFMGPITEVDAYVANLSHPSIEVDDTAVAIIRFVDGALGNIVASNSQYPGLYGRLHVHGDSGFSVGVQTETGSAFVAGMTTDIEPPFNDLWTVPGEASNVVRWRKLDRLRFRGRDIARHYHRLQVQDFLEAVARDREPAVSGYEGRNSVELLTALYRAQRSRGRISFPLGPDPLDDTPGFE